MPAITKGHWPRGKRRNADAGTWATTRKHLARLLTDHLTRGIISIRVLAGHLDVADRTVRRWLDETDQPDAATQAAIAEWIRERMHEMETETRKRGRR